MTSSTIREVLEELVEETRTSELNRMSSRAWKMNDELLSQAEARIREIRLAELPKRAYCQLHLQEFNLYNGNRDCQICKENKLFNQLIDDITAKIKEGQDGSK